MEDYSNFGNVVAKLKLNIKNHTDINSFIAMVRMVHLLCPVVLDNVEWNEWLDLIVMEFALASPLTMVKYLDECSQDEFDLVFLELNKYIYEIPGKRAELDSELVKISAKEKKYVETIAKIRNRMNKDCVEYFKGDEEYNYCKE